MTFSRKNIDASTISVTIELGISDLALAVKKARQKLGGSITVDGFRPGKAPQDVIEKNLDPRIIGEEALQIAVSESLGEFVEREKIDVLDQKDFSIKENSKDRFVYSITFILYPSVKLGQYKEIPFKKNKTSTSDEEIREKDRIRIGLINAVAAGSNVHVPEKMVELQLDAMMENFDLELHAQGLEPGPYLAHLKKNRDDLRKEWRATAQEQVKIQLVMHAIVRAENIRVDDREIQDAVQNRIQQYLGGRQDANLNDIKQEDIERLRSRIYSVLLNQKVFDFVESHAIITA